MRFATFAILLALSLCGNAIASLPTDPVVAASTPVDVHAVQPSPAQATVKPTPQNSALFSAPPAYPEQALRSGIGGTVILQVTFNATGIPVDIQMASSSGNESLDKAAIESAKDWRMRPREKDGPVVAGTVRIPIKFDPRSQPYNSTIASVHPSPEYPLDALKNGISGTVDLLVRIDATGEPIDIEVETSSGSRELDRAAVDTMKKWRFYPHLEHGVAVKWVARIPFVF
jgi:TonB family protein